jgi:hypothetical protein
MAGFAQYIPMAMQAVGSVLSFTGAQSAGKQARQAAEYSAKVDEINAGQQQAAAQRQASEERRRAQFAQSRALALAAASGAGAGDSTVADIISDLASEGAYRSMTALYEGEDRARALKQRAAGTRYSGEATQSAYRTQGFASALKGGSSLFEKYASRSSLVSEMVPGQFSLTNPQYG